MDKVVVVSACRSAIGRFGGSLKSLTGGQLAAPVMKAAIKRAQIDPSIIGDVRMGCCMERCDEMNVARVAALKAGIPQEVPSVTIQRVCDSGMEAIVSGALLIQNGYTDVVLAGGVESMSNTPIVSFDARFGVGGGRGYTNSNHVFVDSLYQGLHAGADVIMGLTAENVAEKWNLSREAIDEVACRSHNNAEKATKNGDFKEEIVPIEVPQRKKSPLIFDKDEHFRPGMTMETLAKLPPAFKKGGKVTAGNASGINDGAAALIIMNEKKAKELGLTPLASLIDFGIAGVDPLYMGEGPIPATKKALERANMKLDDMDRIECNEAFAATYLATEIALGWDREIANVHGSGVGLGHPVGCTGARIVVTLLHELKRKKLNYGLATLCGGGGLGMTTIWQCES
ncbi:MAG: thiolase family protein [Candidatus Helarchaeota archaeon]